MSPEVAFSSIVLEVLLTTCITSLATESTESSLISLYRKLISLSLFTAALTLLMSIMLRHTTLFLVGLLLTIM